MAVLRFDIHADSAQSVAVLRQFTQQISATGPAAQRASNQATTAFDRMEKVIGKARSAVIGFISAVAFAKVIQGLRDVVNAGIEFESSFAGIRKTLDATDDQFAVLSDRMRDLAIAIPIGVNELNKIGEIAGQLGIPVREIEGFTTTVAKIGLTTNLSVEEAATGFARLSNIMGEPINQVNTMASVMVHLGNKFEANEREILTFSMNLAGAGKLVGMTSSEVSALATALAATGLHAEKAGSAMSRIMFEMVDAVQNGGRELELFSKVSQMTMSQFQQSFKQDAAQTLLEFLGGLNHLADTGQNVIGVLDGLHLSNIRVRDVTLRAQEAVDKYRDAMSEAALEATRAGAAMDTEFNKRMQTTEMELARVTARLHNVAIVLSNEVKASLVNVSKDIATAVEKVSELIIKNRDLIKILGEVAIALVGLKLLAWLVTFEAVKIAIIAIVMATSGWEAAVVSLQSALSLLAPFLRPLILLAAAAAAYELATAYKEQVDAVEKASRAETKMRNTIQQRVNELRKAGAVIDEVNLRGIQVVEKELAAGDKWVAQKAKEANARREAIRLDDEETRKRIDNLKKGITDIKQNGADMNTALRELVAAGTPASAIFDKLGSKIQDIARDLRNAGLEVPRFVGLFAGMVPELEDVLTRLQQVRDTIRRFQIENITTEQAALSGVNQIPAVSLSAGGNIPLSASPGANVPIVDLSAGIGGLGRGVDPAHLEWQKEYWENFGKEAEAASREIGTAMDRLFEKIIRNGKLAWKDIASFASEVFETLATGLMKPFKDKFLVPLSQKLGEIAVKISETLGRVLGATLGPIAGLGASLGIAAIMNFAGRGSGTATGSPFDKMPNRLIPPVVEEFTAAMTALHDAFFETAEAGDLTLENAAAGRAAVVRLWSDFKASMEEISSISPHHAKVVKDAIDSITEHWGDDMSVILGNMDGVIESLGGTAGMTVEQVKELTKAIAAIEDFKNAVDNLVASVTQEADSADITTAALQRLVEQGIPTELIIKKLGGSITDMAEQMRILGMEIPAIVLQFERLSRLSGIKTELEEVTKQLGEALVAKLGWLDNAIKQTKNDIDGWRKDIEKLDESIKDSREKLADAEYWQKRYASSIRDVENAAEEAAKKRKSVEQEITQLTVQVEKDRLKAIIDTWDESAASSKMETATSSWISGMRKYILSTFSDVTSGGGMPASVAAAKKQLEELERNEELKAMVERKDRLAELQASLAGVREEEENALKLLADKQIAAKAAIDIEKLELQAKLTAAQLQRMELNNYIVDSNTRLLMLERERTATISALDEMGIARLDELGKMNATITTLLDRGTALENERHELQLLLDMEPAVSGFFQRLRDMATGGATPSTILDDGIIGGVIIGGGNTSGGGSPGSGTGPGGAAGLIGIFGGKPTAGTGGGPPIFKPPINDPFVGISAGMSPVTIQINGDVNTNSADDFIVQLQSAIRSNKHGIQDTIHEEARRVRR